jgi:hypothetical protein
MLQLEPKRWYSWAFTVSGAGRPVAELDISAWRERGGLTIQGAHYTVTRQGLLSGEFRLESPGGTVATATKDGVMGRRFEVVHGGKTFTLKRRSWWARDMVLLDGEREVGAIAPAGMFTRRGAADLPETVPLPLRIFFIWLALLVWKRDADAAHAAT